MKKRILSFTLAFIMVFALLPLSVSAAEATVTDSQGVKYILSYGGTYYTVSSFDNSVSEIVIPSEIDGVPVTSIQKNAFYNCKGLTNIEIPNSVTTIGKNAFRSCTSLTSIEIPNSVTAIGDYAFDSCTSLTSIKISNSATNIGEHAFCNCSKNLISITVDSGNTVYHSKDNCLIKTATNTLILGCKNSIIPDYVTTIGAYAFYNCVSLTSIEIPASVKSIGSYAFHNCRSLTSIEIPNSVIYILNDAFSDCTSLTSMEISDSVTEIRAYAFWGCTSLTSIEIPNSVTTIGDFAFYGCEGLTSIELSSSVISIGSDAFSICSKSLMSIIVDSGNTVYHSKDNCLIETETNTMILGCKNSIIPDYVTTIGNHAFYGCEGLTSIEISNSVTTIGGYAFYGCESLTDIYCEAESQPEGWNDAWLGNCTATVHWGCKDVVVTEPTCTEQGYTTHTCSICGDGCINNYVPANGHIEGEWKSFTEPTCDEQGYTTYICDVCGDSYNDNFVDEKGHTEGEWEVVIEPQIGVAGQEEKRCTECGELLDTKPIDPLQPEYRLGDVNGDDEIDKNDYLLVKRYCFGTAELDETQRLAANVNGDGEIGKEDYLLIKRYCFGTASLG